MVDIRDSLGFSEHEHFHLNVCFLVIQIVPSD